MQNWKYNQLNQVYEKQYKYATVAILQAKYCQAFKEKLNKYSIDCVIFAPFEKFPLAGVTQTSILYHNIEFPQLLSIVTNNPYLMFDGKHTLTILITQYIRLVDRTHKNIMTQTQLNTLNSWLKMLFPNEKLKMWMYVNEDNEQEYYMETESRVSSLYMYIVMCQFQQRSSFRNPKGLAGISNEEVSSKLKLCYSQ